MAPHSGENRLVNYGGREGTHKPARTVSESYTEW